MARGAIHGNAKKARQVVFCCSAVWSLGARCTEAGSGVDVQTAGMLRSDRSGECVRAHVRVCVCVCVCVCVFVCQIHEAWKCCRHVSDALLRVTVVGKVSRRRRKSDPLKRGSGKSAAPAPVWRAKALQVPDRHSAARALMFDHVRNRACFQW